MEAILILLADLINALSGIAAGLLFILMTALSVLVDVTCGKFFPGLLVDKDVKYNPEPLPTSKDSRNRRRLPSWIKYVLMGAGALSAVLSVLLILAETVYFEQTVRWIANWQTSKTRVQLSFDSVEGSFLKRQFMFQTLHIVRPPEQGDTGFDVNIAQVNGSFEGAFFTIPKSMSELILEGVQGELHLPERSDSVSRTPGKLSLDLILQRKPSFTVRKLVLRNANLEIFSPEKTHLTTITVQEWISAPLRSRYAAFDLLFRSNLDASVGETNITIRTSGEHQARETFWRITPIPISPVTDFLGPPFDIVQNGEAHLEIHDQWSLADDSLFIDSRWNLGLRNLTLEPDDGGNFLSRFRQSAAAGILRRYLEKNDGLELAFHIRIEDGSLSTTINGLVQDLLELAKENGLQIFTRISTGQEN